MPMQSPLIILGVTLIILGFIISFLAVLLMFIRAYRFRGKTRGGGLIMIGPIPIIFGTDRESVKMLILLAVALMILMIIIIFLTAGT